MVTVLMRVDKKFKTRNKERFPDMSSREVTQKINRILDDLEELYNATRRKKR